MLLFVEIDSLNKFGNWSFTLFVDGELHAVLLNHIIEHWLIVKRLHLPELVLPHYVDVLELLNQTIDHQLDWVSSEEILQLLSILNLVSYLHHVFGLLLDKDPVRVGFGDADLNIFQYLITDLHDTGSWEGFDLEKCIAWVRWGIIYQSSFWFFAMGLRIWPYHMVWGE